MSLLVDLIEKPVLTADDCNRFREVARLTISNDDVAKFHQVSHQILNDFREVALERQGFFAFTAEDIAQFIANDLQFGFEFNKKKNQGTLYGFRHTQIRRQLLNQSPQSLVIELIRRKLKNLQILPTEPILEVEDLGMGQAVYRIRTSRQHFVIKRTESAQLQPFYCQVLKALGWPAYESHTHTIQQTVWEITDYLGRTNLADEINFNPHLESSLVIQLAKHAALADVVGRGDRHFENYVVQNHTIFPVDISHLFWDNNEEWIRKYCRAGLYEICADSNQEPLFFEHYSRTMAELNSQKNVIIGAIERHFPDSAESKTGFVSARLTPQYLDDQIRLYQSSIDELNRRKPYQSWLNAMALVDPDHLKSNELLYMYFLANQNRNAAFFLIEERQEPILDWIKSWAHKHGFDSEAV